MSGVVPHLTRQVLWRRLDTPGLEHCLLDQHEHEVTVSGQVIVELDGSPLTAQYSVMCAADWRTRVAQISLPLPISGPMTTATIRLRAENDRWYLQTLGPRGSRGHEVPELQGCVDVDLGVTPSTNTLPIRRLNLAVGASAEVTAAWVRFPELTVEPLAQRYTRLDERRYRYESDSGFSAELEVDELGLVVRYGDIWERVG